MFRRLDTFRHLRKAISSFNSSQQIPRQYSVRTYAMPATNSSKFCKQCGSAMQLITPEGDDKERSACTSCGFVDYQNPKLVVGAIVEHNNMILLCRRGIMPQKGLWTVPAGFLEIGESTAAGAIRETREEANANIEIIAPYVHFDIVGIGQAYVLFRSKLAAPFTFEAQQPESLEAQLFPMDEIPYDELAFSSVSLALKSYVAERKAGKFCYHHGSIIKKVGSGPNEPGSFSLVDHIAIPTGWGP